MKNISVVLPVFNEKKSLSYVLKAWHDFFNRESIEHEFVICEDGSTDGTKELILDIKEKFPISDQSSENREGYGGGVTRGILASKYEYILCIDSDGQCMPNSFLKFYNCEIESDIIIGNRNPRRDPKLRIIYSKLLKVFHDFLFHSKISDPSCPYIFAKKKIIEFDIEHFERYDGASVVYKFTKMPSIIFRNLIGLVKLKRSFN